jgi:zinc transport system substrate-binding protein
VVNSRQALLLVVVAALVATALILAVIGSEDEGEDGRVKVVSSFWPLTHFTEEIGGERVKVTTLVDYNQEVHGWSPSTGDILAADEADVIVYNGMGLDEWMESDILPAIKLSGKVIVETTKDLYLYEPNIDPIIDVWYPSISDPHTWTDPVLAYGQARFIYWALLEADPEGEAYYKAGWHNLSAQFSSLVDTYFWNLTNRTRDTFFVSHEAFGNIALHYGLEQVGVIGVSAEEQPSAHTIAEIVDMMVDSETFVLYVDPVYSDEYGQALKRELEAQTDEDVKVLKLYLMLGPVDGLDFFEQQEANLEALKIGLEVQD